MKLSGNTILITGGTSGLGQAFAEEFLRLGNTVIICGRRIDRLAHLKEEHPELLVYQADVCRTESREALVTEILKHHPDINVLINNAGVQYYNNVIDGFELARAEEEVCTNLIAPLHMVALLSERLQAQPEAAIINVTSGLAFAPISYMPVYCATKAALHSATLSLRHQLRDSAVEVIEIAPPATDTELGHQNRTDREQSHGGIPVEDFISEAIEGLRLGSVEILVGGARRMREVPEEMFAVLNR